MAERGAPALTRHVRDVWRDVPELIDAAEGVEQLLRHPGWHAVHRILDREVATIDRQLDEGPPRDLGEYAKAHGRRGALRAAEEAATAIVGESQRARKRAEEEAAERQAAETAQREREEFGVAEYAALTGRTAA